MKIHYKLLCIIFSFSFIGNVSASLEDGLVAYYPFNGNTLDESGNNNPAGIPSHVISSPDRFGNIDSAYDFEASADSSIKLPHTLLNGLTKSTVSIWIKPEKNDELSIISGANSEKNNEYLIFMRTGQLELHIKDQVKKSSKVINDGQWHHIIITLDSSSRMLQSFIDGILEDTAFVPAGAITIDADGLWLGREQDCLAGCFDQAQGYQGSMDELRIYNRILSQTEIQQLYENTNTDNCDSSSISSPSNTVLMLGNNATFALLNNATIFGANGNETLQIAGTPNATVDSNIERIEFSKALDYYQFLLTGNILTISNTHGTVANITASDKVLKLAFKDGSVDFNLTGLDNGVLSNGALVLNNNFELSNIKSLLNKDDPSDSTLINIGSVVSQCPQ